VELFQEDNLSPVSIRRQETLLTITCLNMTSQECNGLISRIMEEVAHHLLEPNRELVHLQVLQQVTICNNNSSNNKRISKAR